MSNLYETLCVVRTSMLNVIGVMYVEGRARNVMKILEDIGDEIGSRTDFIEGLNEMDLDELHDLGFEFLDDNKEYLLFPVWLYPFIPDKTELTTVEGEPFIKGLDTVSVHNQHWLNIVYDFIL